MRGAWAGQGGEGFLPHEQAAREHPAGSTPVSPQPWLALLWFNCALCSVTKCKTLGMSCEGGELRDPVASLDLTECGRGCPLVF